MLTYSPEAGFLLAVFALVVSGLPLAALIWIHFRERTPSRGRGISMLGFALLCAAFAGQAAYSRLRISPEGVIDMRFDWLLLASDSARVAASASLVLASLVHARYRTRLRSFAVFTAAVTGGVLVWMSSGWTPDLGRIDSWTPLRAADCLVLGVGAVALAPLSWLSASGLSVLAAARASALIGVWWAPVTEGAWGATWALTLTGLILLALTVERESRRTLLHHVLRFNLVFLTLAASLTLLLAELGRHQFVDFSASQIRDVAEFARGHLITQYRLGRSAEAALASPDVTDQFIREFGRYPDLRRIRLEIHERRMELAINMLGEIRQRSWMGTRAERSKVTPADFAEAPLLSESVVVDGQDIGRVELHHSTVRMNAEIGRQMEAAFVVFTVFVLIGSVVTGGLVHVADRTIGRQYEELAEAQRRLAQSERLASIGAVTSAMAHEISNPVGVLVTRSDYLLSVIRDEPVAPAIAEDLETIQRQAQRIAKTVRDLLNSAARTRYARDPVDIGAVVESAIALVRPAVRQPDVAFHWHSPEPLVRVWGDRDRLEQVLVNLFSNAAHAIESRGQVTITASTRAGGAWADLVVRDTGSGIKAEDLGRIFDPFFTTKEAGVGTGLGLSIVRRIVHDHGGHIDVDTALGQGTAFRIALPAVPAGADVATAADSGTARTVGHPTLAPARTGGGVDD